MRYLKYGLGIDTSLEKFHVCLSVIDTFQKVTTVSSASFNDNINGFEALQQWRKKHCSRRPAVVYLVESTGIYHEQLAWYLFNKNCRVKVILPNKSKKYKEALGLKSKMMLLMQQVFQGLPANSI